MGLPGGIDWLILFLYIGVPLIGGSVAILIIVVINEVKKKKAARSDSDQDQVP